jgi:hypothetical protein
VLPAPGAHAIVVREQRAFRTGVQVALRHRDAQRCAVGVAVQAQRAARGLQDEVAVRPVRLGTALAERRDRHVHQRRIHRRQVGVAEAARRHHARGRRLDEEVGAAREAEQLVTVRAVVEVEHDAALAAREGPPVQRALRVLDVAGERPDATGTRAAGRLDVDHVGAEVAQDLAAEDSAVVGEVEDTARLQHGRLPATAARRRRRHEVYVGRRPTRHRSGRNSSA